MATYRVHDTERTFDSKDISSVGIDPEFFEPAIKCFNESYHVSFKSVARIIQDFRLDRGFCSQFSNILLDYRIESMDSPNIFGSLDRFNLEDTKTLDYPKNPLLEAFRIILREEFPHCARLVTSLHIHALAKDDAMKWYAKLDFNPETLRQQLKDKLAARAASMGNEDRIFIIPIVDRCY